MAISYTETYRPDRDGLADLDLPVDLEATLSDASDAVRAAIAVEITEKIREHGVDTETGEWYGTWSAEDVVRRVLDRVATEETPLS